jgi:hypothetical protein
LGILLLLEAQAAVLARVRVLVQAVGRALEPVQVLEQERVLDRVLAVERVQEQVLATVRVQAPGVVALELELALDRAMARVLDRVLELAGRAQELKVAERALAEVVVLGAAAPEAVGRVLEAVVLGAAAPEAVGRALEVVVVAPEAAVVPAAVVEQARAK